MIYHSVLVLAPDGAARLGRLLGELCTVMAAMGKPYEIVCLDDGSPTAARQGLRNLLLGYPCLRVLCLDPAGGPSALISEGIAAARGEVLIVIEAGDRFSPREIPRLVTRLARADAVFGCRRAAPLVRLGRRAACMIRRILTGIDVHDPGCLLWAARIEALQGLRLAGRQHRALAGLLARRGYRVGELHVHDHACHESPSWSNWTGPCGLLTDWLRWKRPVRWRVSELREPVAAGRERKVMRVDPAQPLSQRAATPNAADRRNTA